MEFLEKDLETIIWEASDEQLEKAGLYFNGKRYRQLRIGKYGIADLVTFEKSKAYDYDLKCDSFSHNHIKINVYELKKEKIGISAFLQAIGYLKGIQRYIDKRGLFSNCNVEYKITLIGKSIDTSGSFIYLTDLLVNYIEDFTNNFYITRPLMIDFFTYNITINGLKFKEHRNYKLIDEGF